MKLITILKDSFREAVDTKVFYVMVALSGCLTLFIALISFRPAPAEELKDQLSLPLNGNLEEMLRPQPGFRRPSPTGAYTISSVEPLNGAPDNPDSPLLFTVRGQYTAAEAAKIENSPEQTRDYIRSHFASFPDGRSFVVTDVSLGETPKSGQIVWHVRTQPNRATRLAWPHEIVFAIWPLTFLGKAALGIQLYTIEGYLVNGVGAWVAILISVIITAFFIPNMLRKGTIDLLLVKPVGRVALLCYKYVGGLTFTILNTAAVVLGVWMVLGLRSGVWTTSFLLSIPVVTFYFAILYSVSTLCAVFTRSAIVAILLSCLTWFALYSVGQLYMLPNALRQMEDMHNTPAEQRISDGAWVKVVNAVHYVLPRAKDLDFLMNHYLLEDLLVGQIISARQLDTGTIHWGESLTVSVIFIAVMLGIACLKFVMTDY
jgi:ABC-type transport system involved in multi-copper enzyme maturation permease subunit